jgi:hypothetical protein
MTTTTGDNSMTTPIPDRITVEAGSLNRTEAANLASRLLQFVTQSWVKK